MNTISNKPAFWGSFIVRNSQGTFIRKGEIYSHNDAFPEHAIQRIVSQHSKNCAIKLLPGIRCKDIT